MITIPSSVILVMIYFNNPASTFNITILINLSPKQPVPKWLAPKSHVPDWQCVFCNGTRRYSMPAPFPSYEKKIITFNNVIQIFI